MIAHSRRKKNAQSNSQSSRSSFKSSQSSRPSSTSDESRPSSISGESQLVRHHSSKRKKRDQRDFFRSSSQDDIMINMNKVCEKVVRKESSSALDVVTEVSTRVRTGNQVVEVAGTVSIQAASPNSEEVITRKESICRSGGVSPCISPKPDSLIRRKESATNPQRTSPPLSSRQRESVHLLSPSPQEQITTVTQERRESAHLLSPNPQESYPRLPRQREVSSNLQDSSNVTQRQRESVHLLSPNPQDQITTFTQERRESARLLSPNPQESFPRLPRQKEVTLQESSNVKQRRREVAQLISPTPQDQFPNCSKIRRISVQYILPNPQESYPTSPKEKDVLPSSSDDDVFPKTVIIPTISSPQEEPKRKTYVPKHKPRLTKLDFFQPEIETSIRHSIADEYFDDVFTGPPPKEDDWVFGDAATPGPKKFVKKKKESTCLVPEIFKRRLSAFGNPILDPNIVVDSTQGRRASLITRPSTIGVTLDQSMLTIRDNHSHRSSSRISALSDNHSCLSEAIVEEDPGSYDSGCYDDVSGTGYLPYQCKSDEDVAQFWTIDDPFRPEGCSPDEGPKQELGKCRGKRRKVREKCWEEIRFIGVTLIGKIRAFAKSVSNSRDENQISNQVLITLPTKATILTLERFHRFRRCVIFLWVGQFCS